MPLSTLDGEAAWTAAAKGSAAQWNDVAQRFLNDVVIVDHRPKFSLEGSPRFFCLGSCFARNIEEHLIYRGVDVLSKRVVSPKTEWPARANGFLNKFTTDSMLQELRWLENPPEDVAARFLEMSHGWRDMHLTPGMGAVTLERALERRAWLASDYFPRLRQADVVVVTLGLNEVWRDNLLDERLNAAPGLREVKREPGRYSLEVTDVAENLAALEEIRTRLKRLNPLVRMIVTVSPVPMRATFSGRDVMVANMLSKSTLRAAADAFQLNHDDVDYFPSYEIVSLTPRAFAYGADCLHVTDRVVGHVMETFLTIYLGGSTRLAPEDFTELEYLDANPDVEDAVRRGELGSGFEHWSQVGQSEGRPLRPETQSQRASRAGL